MRSLILVIRQINPNQHRTVARCPVIKKRAHTYNKCDPVVTERQTVVSIGRLFQSFARTEAFGI